MEDLFKYAEFENKVRYSHCDSLLCDLDDELMQLGIDRLCTELDIEIAEAIDNDTEALHKELEEIEEEIERVEFTYNVVMDFFDDELIAILSSAEEKKRMNKKYEEVVDKLFFNEVD